MRPLVRALVRVDDLAASLALWLCAAILLAMVTIAGLGVVFRFGLHASLSWSEELDAYLFVWLTCLGAAAGVKRRAHPNVQVFIDRLGERQRAAVGVAADVAIFVFGALFAFYGGQLILLMGEETASSLPFSMSYPAAAVPVGGALFMLHSLTHAATALFDPAAARGAASAAHAASHDA